MHSLNIHHMHNLLYTLSLCAHFCTLHIPLTLPFSSKLVNITIVAVHCSQTIRQKSEIESATGPSVNELRIKTKWIRDSMILISNLEWQCMRFAACIPTALTGVITRIYYT